MIRTCKGCGNQEEHHGKGYCYGCYRKFSWKPKKGICKRCGKEKQLHAKEVCPGCYTTIFRLQYNKNWNYQNRHNISLELYRKITKKCVVCNFDKIIDLHHLDCNKENNSEENLIGLCPNHHKMIHHNEFRQEVIKLLQEKSIK